MGDEDQRAGEALEACSSCSTASRSRWLVGSSRTSTFTPPDLEDRQRGPGPLAGGQRSGGRATWSAPRPNLASAERARPGRPPGGGVEAVEQVGAPVNASRAWLISPTTTLGPPWRPDARGRRPSRAPSSVDLPEPLAPTTASRSPQPTSSVTGPSVKPRPRPSGPGRSTTARRGGPRRRRCGRRRRSEAQVPALEGLVDHPRAGRGPGRWPGPWRPCARSWTTLRWRMYLSGSPSAWPCWTPWVDHWRWVRARSVRASRLSA